MSDVEPDTEASSKPEKPLNELLSRTMVDLYVGPDSTHWNLHEKLLCYYSPFFARVFYGDRSKQSKAELSDLSDEDDRTFSAFVGWLYSRAIKAPASENDIGPLLELYLFADKFEVGKLAADLVDLVREFYYKENTYPGLRRVQYIYANTDEDNAMREMMVGSVARFLTLGDKIPSHWEKALRKNGQLAVDIIRSIQEWHLESRSVPDARDGSLERGRGGGFAEVVAHEDGESFDSMGMKIEEADE